MEEKPEARRFAVQRAESVPAPVRPWRLRGCRACGGDQRLEADEEDRGVYWWACLSCERRQLVGKTLQTRERGVPMPVPPGSRGHRGGYKH